ncbi:hypothetical protein AAY473_006599 [Plecturocebus cupreus]
MFLASMCRFPSPTLGEVHFLHSSTEAWDNTPAGYHAVQAADVHISLPQEDGKTAISGCQSQPTCGSKHFGKLRSGVEDQPGQHGETPSLLKNTKISQAWWHMPITPITREAKAGESLEPGRRRLQ